MSAALLAIVVAPYLRATHRLSQFRWGQPRGGGRSRRPCPGPRWLARRPLCRAAVAAAAAVLTAPARARRGGPGVGRAYRERNPTAACSPRCPLLGSETAAAPIPRGQPDRPSRR